MLRLLTLSVSLFLISWLFTLYTPKRDPPLFNYDSQIFFDPSPTLGPFYMPPGSAVGPEGGMSYFMPSSREELVRVVKAVGASANRKGSPKRQMRVLGAGHSWSAVARSDDLYLSLCNYKGLVAVDTTSLQATFHGGTTLNEVNAILEEYGLAMTQLGSISDQTVAGAIATGTHGSGITFGNLATLVVKIELVTTHGDILTLSADDDDTDLFRAAQVSLGLLGVISEVTFQCESSFNLEDTRSILPLQSCLENMSQLVHSAQHVKMWVEVFSEMCVLYQANRTTGEPRDNPSVTILNAKNVFYDAFIGLISHIPSIIPGAMTLLFRYGDALPPYNRVDTSYRVFNIPHDFPVHSEAEMVVGIEDCALAIAELKAFVEEERVPLNYITEIRFVQGDNIQLSPNYQRDSCHLTLCINRASDADRLQYFTGIFNRYVDKGLKPRIHWGKYFDLSGVSISDLYPEVDNFLKYRQRLDPDKVFVNRLLSQTLGILS